MSNEIDLNPDDGTFTVALRLLGNEVFAVSVSADPFNNRWVTMSVLIVFLTVIGLSIFGQPLANFYNTLTNAPQQIEVKVNRDEG